MVGKGKQFFYSLVMQRIQRALISLFHKEPAVDLIRYLDSQNVDLYATGGTFGFIESLGIKVTLIEDITGFPEILGGRVKTLHPSVFGGILARKDNSSDLKQLEDHRIPLFDMVVVDLYPFEKTLAGNPSHQDIIEKIDIGGISLIRAAAKNYAHVFVVPAERYFGECLRELSENACHVSESAKKKYASLAFAESSRYDSLISQYLDNNAQMGLQLGFAVSNPLRYGENPHQQASFYGDFGKSFEQVSGKPVSYNNILDIDAAVALMYGIDDPGFAIIKHTNVCGMALRDNARDAFEAALAGDTVSAFGGVIIANRPISADTAEVIHPLFFEVLISPGYTPEAFELLSTKKNRILLRQKSDIKPGPGLRSALDGMLWQTPDNVRTTPDSWKVATSREPDITEAGDLLLANHIVRHLKSNAIALVRNSMLIGMGCGQTSRIDAAKQAIDKARQNGHETLGAVMASDAFFPFPDCVELAHKAGIKAVIQPGGSVRDQDSIDFCDQSSMAMVITGIRHFKH